MIASRTPRQKKPSKVERETAMKNSAPESTPGAQPLAERLVEIQPVARGAVMEQGYSSPPPANGTLGYRRNPKSNIFNYDPEIGSGTHGSLSSKPALAAENVLDARYGKKFISPRRSGYHQYPIHQHNTHWKSWRSSHVVSVGEYHDDAVWRRHFRVDPTTGEPTGERNFPQQHGGVAQAIRPASKAKHPYRHRYPTHNQAWPRHQFGVVRPVPPQLDGSIENQHTAWHWQANRAIPGSKVNVEQEKCGPRPQSQDRTTHLKSLSSTPSTTDKPHHTPQARRQLSTPSKTTSYGAKRLLSPQEQIQLFKKAKGFDMLDLLCTATLEIGELQENPTGCSCPKSKCVALYCDCFKAGRRCDPSQCSCLDCKNTVAESGSDGARTKAIRCILARNPRAFTTAGQANPSLKLPPGEIACNCIRSRCLKLYCSCFHNKKVCKPGICTCVGCHNTTNDTEGRRKAAIRLALQKRPDAFQIKVRKKGQGCACKNNRCVRKYCECFRTGLDCTSKCSCRQCENTKGAALVAHNEKIEH